MLRLDFTRSDLNLPEIRDTTRRVSISGVQDKVQLKRKRGGFSVVESGGDYILKPIKEEEIRFALEKFSRLTSAEEQTYRTKVEHLVEQKREDRERVFLIHHKDKLIPLAIEQIAFFYTSNERVTATTHEGKSYPIDRTLEQLQASLPSEVFFRANRQFIISREAVKDIAIWFGSRLALNLKVETPEKIIISKARVPEFKLWLTVVQPSN